MPINTVPSLPISLGRGETANIDELAGSDLSNQVSVAFVTPFDVENDTLYVVMRVLGSLSNIIRLGLFFSFRLHGWKDIVSPGLNAIQPALSLRRLTVTSGSVGAMVALINHAPALEYLSISFYSMTCDAETDAEVGDGALSCLRRLIVRHVDTPSTRECVSQILESSGGSLWSLSTSADMNESLEVMRQSADFKFNFAYALVHLSLTADDPTQSSFLGGCEHSSKARDDEIFHACSFIQACPRLVHLSLQGYHAEDIPRIIVNVNRPLVSLAIQGKTCDNINASMMIRSMLEEGHQAVSPLRLLALHRDAVDPDWPPVSAL